MTVVPGRASSSPRDGLFRAIAHERRRTILRILKRVTATSPEGLATHLVAEESDKSLGDVPPAEAEQARLSIKHAHLPQLIDVGLLTREDGVVTTTRHPALHDPKLDAMITTEAPGWDRVLATLADEERRVMLSALYRNEGPMNRIELATEVAETVHADGETDVAVDVVITNMHHVHLPKLEEAGLVTYDDGDRSVTFEGHPALDAEWIVAGGNDSPRAILSMAD